MIHLDTSPQGSAEWKQARNGKVTCSNLSKVLAKGEGKTRLRYMRELAAELITGIPTETYSNDYMARGTEQEAEARDLLALELGEITECGFMYDDEKKVGFSPDGLYDKGFIELKSALGPIQIERLEKYVLPVEHRAQVLGGLWISGKQEAMFQSYSPGLPRLVVKVSPDPAYFDMLVNECGSFNEELITLVNKIKQLY